MLIEFEAVSKHFAGPAGTVAALEGVSFTLAPQQPISPRPTSSVRMKMMLGLLTLAGSAAASAHCRASGSPTSPTPTVLRKSRRSMCTSLVSAQRSSIAACGASFTARS